MSEVTGSIVVQRSVRLEMSEDVAITLHALVGEISGSAKTTYRGHAELIRLALCDLIVANGYGRFTGCLYASEVV